MKIYLTSDLHDQRYIKHITAPESADVIVLAGDIEYHETAFDHFASFEKPVVCVTGNHDFYGREITSGIDEIKAIVAQYSNIHLLENETVDIDGVQFIGSTFWTNYCDLEPRMMLEARSWMNDTKCIKANDWWSDENNQDYIAEVREKLLDKCKIINFKSEPDVARYFSEHYSQYFKSFNKDEFHPIIAYQLNQQAIEFVSSELAKPFDGKKVVVTHHAPTHELLRQSVKQEFPGFTIDADLFDEFKYLPLNFGRSGHMYPIDAHYLAGYGSNLENLFEDDGKLAGADLWCHGHDHSQLEYSLHDTRFATNAFGRDFIRRKLMAEARDEAPMSFITKFHDGSDKLFET